MAFAVGAFQVDAFQIGDAVGVVPSGDIALGGGGFWKVDHDRRSARWKKRKEQLDRIAALLAGVSEQIPDDAPEAQPVKAARIAVDRAERALLADVPAPTVDWTALAADIRRAERALAKAERAFDAYVLRLADEDEDDDLLMMS